MEYFKDLTTDKNLQLIYIDDLICNYLDINPNQSGYVSVIPNYSAWLVFMERETSIENELIYKEDSLLYIWKDIFVRAIGKYNNKENSNKPLNWDFVAKEIVDYSFSCLALIKNTDDKENPYRLANKGMIANCYEQARFMYLDRCMEIINYLQKLNIVPILTESKK